MVSADIVQYVAEVSRLYQTGKATEHSYRSALLRLLENIAAAQTLSQIKSLRFTNEPKRIACGAPDYIVTRNGIPVGYIEAKDIGMDLGGKAHKAQFDRYKQSLSNLIFTDYLDFHRYISGELADSVSIAEIKNGKITPIKANFEHFERLIVDFGTAHPQGIASPAELAQMMAAKARLMAELIENSFAAGGNDGKLAEEMDAFKQVLIHDITPKEFADIYAQTIAYGLFAARLHDAEPETFCRQKAASLIPKTNPFLRQFFHTIAGLDLDGRISWIVDDLADVFRAADMFNFRESLGEHTAQNDPMIHFYEDFLSEYDPALRKNRGVWYTPQPIVSFIVSAVDEILQNEFKLPMGLADASKTKIDVIDQSGETSVAEAHKVQILDPATGTGTFLAETVNRIHAQFKNQAGAWQSYVKEHLIERLNGFEILMASYTMAHIKLEYLLSQTGYEPVDNQRLRIFLTNSLERYHLESGTPFARFLAHEANGASEVKRDAPIMVVMGNPPYNVSTQNKNEWIQNLIADYKKGLNERKLNLDDDYIKFIRYGQHYIERNGEGILAYISNNSFIDGVTHRQMRKVLLETFDKIYILDLHGSAKKKEVCPNGGKDENVFDIQQGVSINIFVKTGKKKDGKLAQVFHRDMYGLREEKFAFLLNNAMKTVYWERIENKAPDYFFVPKDDTNKEEYEKGLKITDLFPVYNSGVSTDRDSLFIDGDKKALADRFKILLSGKFDGDFRRKYRVEDSSSYKLTEAIKGKPFVHSFIHPIEYRPFDRKWIYYSPELISRPADKAMKHLINGENVGLITQRLVPRNNAPYRDIFIANTIIGKDSIRNNAYMFPLYLYPDADHPLPGETRAPNLDAAIVAEISTRVGLRFTAEKANNSKTFAPIDILDYIYAVLHSPRYREKYKAFLKIDFPRVPCPADAGQFRRLAKLGEKLRRLHLLESVEPKDGMADFPITGNGEIDKIIYAAPAPKKSPPVEGTAGGRVYINSKQYFDNVPPEAWEFHIGGYRPARKWLKDRNGLKLEYDDVRHYRKIIRVLTETAKIMEEIIL